MMVYAVSGKPKRGQEKSVPEVRLRAYEGGWEITIGIGRSGLKRSRAACLIDTEGARELAEHLLTLA